jgi:hypothetical protein
MAPRLTLEVHMTTHQKAMTVHRNYARKIVCYVNVKPVYVARRKSIIIKFMGKQFMWKVKSIAIVKLNRIKQIENA